MLDTSTILGILLEMASKQDEESLEGVCVLLKAVGGKLEASGEVAHVEACFELFRNGLAAIVLSPRIRFLMGALVKLRANRWQEEGGIS